MNVPFLNLPHLLETARLAGQAIMEIYQKDFKVEYKQDQSPLTEADKASNAIISSRLRASHPNLPILSEEESHNHNYEFRKGWEYFWMVDPLDGTKEFVKKNGEFTVNIALIFKNSPIAGAVYAPAKDWLYYSDGISSFKQVGLAPAQVLNVNTSRSQSQNTLRVVGSRSHASQEFLDYCQSMELKYSNLEIVSMGSSLKLCLVAENKADVYPRLGPTMEWDTAAAHAVVKTAGKNVYNFKTDTELTYNKPNLLNEWFIVK